MARPNYLGVTLNDGRANAKTGYVHSAKAKIFLAYPFMGNIC